MKYLSSVILLFSLQVFAKVTIETVQYKEGNTVLEGVVAYDPALVKKNGLLPGVVVVHDWMGVGYYVKSRAAQLAQLGYVALVADIYGKGVRPKDTKEAGALVTKFKAGDRKAMRERAFAAYEYLKKNKNVNHDKISAMGYCFGGTVALEMARLGLPLTGVISFHGGLASVKAEEAKNIKSRLLILHGAIDPFVPATEVIQFQKELNDANVSYEFVSYSGAVHAFTEKHVGTDITTGAAYNERADKRSFAAMEDFLKEVNK